MKDYSILILQTLNEEMGDVGAGALIGGAVGAGSAALGWLRKRSALKQKMVQCQGDPSCIEQTKMELQALNAASLRSGVRRGLGGAALGAGAGAVSGAAKGALSANPQQGSNIIGKGASAFYGTGGDINKGAAENILPAANAAASVGKGLYDVGQQKSWPEVLSQQGDASVQNRLARMKATGQMASNLAGY
mgnify:CR=1 FL=1